MAVKKKVCKKKGSWNSVVVGHTKEVTDIMEKKFRKEGRFVKRVGRTITYKEKDRKW
jgi:hypothetical protein